MNHIKVGLLFFLFALNAIDSVTAAKSRRRGFINVIQESATTSDYSIADVKEKWIKQKLDNFDMDNTATWWNRYFERDSFFDRDNGPIFLLLRGEDSLSANFMLDNGGAWVNYAQEHKAYLFQLEHRFYGSSFPTENLTVDSLQYLTIQQALADAAYFIRHMTGKKKFTSNNKWIVMGGSYAGSLTMWMAEMYPDLVYGAISSSGPIGLEVNFVQYLEAITASLKNYSSDCASSIQQGFQYLQQAVANPELQNSVTYNLMLCQSAVNATPLDQASLLYTVTGDFMDAVQYNGDNLGGLYMSIAEVCDIMNNETLGTPFDRLIAFNTQYLNQSNEGCIDYNFNELVQQYSETWLQAGVSLTGDRQWIWQQCTDFGFFQTSDGKNQIFGDLFGLNLFTTQCSSVFGSQFDLNYTTAQVKKNNKQLGYLHPNVTRVLDVQGTADPWHTVGLNHNITNDGVEVLVIDGTAHCANMFAPSPSDPPQLTAARVKISNFIGRILSEVEPTSSSSEESSEETGTTFDSSDIDFSNVPRSSTKSGTTTTGTTKSA